MADAKVEMADAGNGMADGNNGMADTKDGMADGRGVDRTKNLLLGWRMLKTGW